MVRSPADHHAATHERVLHSVPQAPNGLRYLYYVACLLANCSTQQRHSWTVRPISLQVSFEVALIINAGLLLELDSLLPRSRIVSRLVKRGLKE